MSDSPVGEEAQAKEELPPQNQEVKDLQSQFVQQQTMLSQLKEALRQSEEHNSSKGKEVEAFASRLSDIKSRSSSRLSSPRGPIVPSLGDESKKSSPGGEAATHSKSLSILRQKVSENRAIFEQRGREKTETKRGVEVMIEQLKGQLVAKDDTIRALQENLEAAISSRQLFPTIEHRTEATAEETVTQTSAYEQKIVELSSQVYDLQATVIGLRENLLEKDSVIDARTKAIALMSEDLCRKGKTTLDQLDDTRDEMRHMQNKFASLEADMKSEREQLMKRLEDKDATICGMEERNEELKLEGLRLTSLITSLQTKMSEIDQRAVTLTDQQVNSDQLSVELAEAKKQIIKLKALTKKQIKQINSFKKGTEGCTEQVDLNNRIAELEEEKGNLQLHLVDFDELKISELHLEESVTQLRAEIASLEAQLKQQSEELAAKDELELQLAQHQTKIEQLQEHIHQVSEMKVQAEMKAVELEESIDDLLKEKTTLSNMFHALQEENTAVIDRSQVDDQMIANRVEIGLMNANERSEDIIADLNNQVAQQKAKNDELIALFSSALGNGTPDDWIQQIISNQDTLSKLADSKSKYENDILEMEHSLHFLEKVLEERNRELDTIKSEEVSLLENNKDMGQNLSAMEITLGQKDAELQHLASEYAKLNKQYRKVIGNLKVKSKAFDENVNQLKSMLEDRDAHITQLKSEFDATIEMREAQREEISLITQLLTDAKQEAATLEQQLEDTKTTLCQEQATRNDAESLSSERLASLQLDFTHQKSLQDEELKNAHSTISLLNEQIANLLRDKELHDLCLTECNCKLTAMFSLLQKRHQEFSSILETIIQQHFTKTELEMELFPIIEDIEYDATLQNLEKVSETFDQSLQKVTYCIQLLGNNLGNKTEELRDRTKLEADLREELKDLNEAIISAERTYNTALSTCHTELENANNTIDRNNARISQLECDLRDLHSCNSDTSADSLAKITELQAIIGSRENSLAEYSQTISETNNRILELELIKADLEQRIELLSAELRNERAQIGTMEALHHEYEERISDNSNIITESSRRIHELEELYSIAEQDVAAVKERNRALAGFEQQFHSLTSEMNRLNCEAFNSAQEFRQESEAKERILETVTSKLAQSQADQKHWETQCSFVSAENVNIIEQCRSSKVRLTLLSETNLELEKEISYLSTKLQSCQEEVIALTTCRNSLEMKLLDAEEALKRFMADTATSLEVKESEIADVQWALQNELLIRKNLEIQLVSLQEACDAKMSVLVQKNDKLKSLLAQIDSFKEMCERDVTDIISQSQIQASQLQNAEAPTVAEAIIVPTMSSTTGTVSVDMCDSWQEQSDEGWGWGVEEAKLEEAHQAISQPSETIVETSHADLQNQLTELEALVKELEGEKEKLTSELRMAQVRSGKLLKKLKELKALNESIVKRPDSGISSLDQTMESEFTLKISALETQVSDLRAEKAQTLKENELIKNHLAALEWQISELTDDGSKMSEVIQWSERNINDKERKIAELLLEVSKLTSDMEEQKETFEKIHDDLQSKILAPKPIEPEILISTAAESELEDLRKAHSEIQALYKKNQAEMQSNNEARTELLAMVQAHEELNTLYQENLSNLEDLHLVHHELKIAYQQTKVDLENLQVAHNQLSSEYQANKTKLTVVLEELKLWKSQASNQEMAMPEFSNPFENQLTQLREENVLFRDMLSVKESEVHNIRQQLSEIEGKCYEAVDQQRLELENMKNILSAKEVQAVQYVQEISNLRTSLSKQASEIEYLKEELVGRTADIDFVSDQLSQSEGKLSDINDMCALKEQDVVKLKSRLDMKDSQLDGVTKELQEHQHIIQLLKSVHQSENKESSNARNLSNTQSDEDTSEERYVSLSEHNIALYSWHQQDMRVNEMSLELMQLVEERDTLQLRLSTSLRMIEELRKLNEGLNLGMATEALPSVSSQTETGSQRHAQQAQAIAEGEEQLANKLDQVRSVGRQQRQMALQNHGGVAMDASYTVSRDAQSQSETLMNWIFGKSTPKVMHI